MENKERCAEIIIENGKKLISNFKIFNDDSILTIGRHQSNDIYLPKDPSISRFHAVIVQCWNHDRNAEKTAPNDLPIYMLRDLGSATGTRIGKVFARKKILENEDKIVIGNYKLTYRQDTSKNTSKSILPLNQQFGQFNQDSYPCLGTVVDSITSGLLNKKESELIASILKGTFIPDIVGHADAFVTAMRSVVRAERCIVGFQEGSSVYLAYQKGFERESPHCDSGFISSLHTDGRKLQAAAIWIPFPNNAFLALFRTHPPSFTEEDACFVELACETLLKSAPAVVDRNIASPWRASIVGLSEIKDLCREIASDETENNSVLITGETGTGKEVLARFIHDCSKRRGKPFVTANCSALPKDLVYSELFGHVKGAFSGAIEAKLGYFEMAKGGTLFLDELGDLPETIQVALLTALQQREIKPLGSDVVVKTDVRILAATDRNVDEMITTDTFRRALHERFPHKLNAPTLRERLHEIPLLAFYFLDLYSKQTKTFTRDALDLLRKYSWPGNVRELQGLVKRLAVGNKEIVYSWDLPEDIRHADKIEDFVTQLGRGLKNMEKIRIEEVLRETRGNMTDASKLLGISRGTLYNKIKQYNMQIHR